MLPALVRETPSAAAAGAGSEATVCAVLRRAQDVTTVYLARQTPQCSAQFATPAAHRALCAALMRASALAE